MQMGMMLRLENNTSNRHSRDIIGRGDTAAVQNMMTRSEKGDVSYEDAPFEKS